MAQQVLKQALKQVLKQSVGLDVSKDTVAACFSQQEIGMPFRILSSRTFRINATGFKQLDEWIVRQRDKTVALHLLMEATGGSTTWDSEKYLNIWVVSFPDSISGYAQMPAGPAVTDGIVIDARYFGKKGTTDKDFPYTEGKTLTHLLGSYLNVYELWSKTRQCGDDGVDDTPIQNAPTLGCVDYRHVSTCDGNPVAMSMNFMDNTTTPVNTCLPPGKRSGCMLV